jgi:hypothetical protein
MAPIPNRLRRWLEGLRFPYLLILMAVLLAVSLVVPDPVPFADELLLLLGTLLLSRLKRKPPESDDAPDS